MIGNKRQLSNTIPTLKKANCPDCGKPRLLRTVQEDGSLTPVSEVTFEVNGSTRYEEACVHCVARYKKEDERYVMENLKKIQNAIKAGPGKTEQDSDHRDFNLDL